MGAVVAMMQDDGTDAVHDLHYAFHGAHTPQGFFAGMLRGMSTSNAHGKAGAGT